MNLLRPLLVIACSLLSASEPGNKELAIKLMNAGQIQEAISEFSKIADKGDTVAMVTIGNLYYEGKGIQQNFAEAMKWYLKACDKNGDALCNLGVLYRDGKGVAQNLKVAYCIFVIIHMKGFGSLDTQYRNGSNLRKTLALITPDQTKEALCLSEEYIRDYVNALGNLPKDYVQTGTRLKDKNWWREGEIPKFDCPCTPESKTGTPAKRS